MRIFVNLGQQRTMKQFNEYFAYIQVDTIE
jgi:hypothetical protein